MVQGGRQALKVFRGSEAQWDRKVLKVLPVPLVPRDLPV